MKDNEELEEKIYRELAELIGIDKKSYNRILTSEESENIDTEAFGYLLSLYNYGTVDHLKLEKLIYCCLYLAEKNDEKLSLNRTKSLVNLLLFYDNSVMSVKELIPWLNRQDDYAGYDELN